MMRGGSHACSVVSGVGQKVPGGPSALISQKKESVAAFSSVALPHPPVARDWGNYTPPV